MIFLHEDFLYTPDQWWRRFSHLLKEQQLEYKIVNALSENFYEKIKKEAKEKDCLIGRLGHNPYDFNIMKPLYPKLHEIFKGRVFPNENDYYYYDDKEKQEKLFKEKKYTTPKTSTILKKEDLENFLEQGISFPIVLKKSYGAGSSNVSLINNEQEATYPAIAQEFCPGNNYDIRINVIGERVMAYKRYNRPNDFRASGSGLLEYPNNLEGEWADVKIAMELAFKISEENGFSSMAYDFIKKDNLWTLLEISYTYPDYHVRDTKFYYKPIEKTCENKEGIYPQDFILEDFIKKHKIYPETKKG